MLLKIFMKITNVINAIMEQYIILRIQIYNYSTHYLVIIMVIWEDQYILIIKCKKTLLVIQILLKIMLL